MKSSFVSAIFGLLSLGGALAHGEASPVLSKVSGSESNVVANWVDAAYRSIAVDDLPIYLEVHQTFGFRIKGSRYFLAPVVYSSKEYRNRVCDLAMFSFILRQNVGQQYRSSGVVAWLDSSLPKLLPNLGEEKSSWKSVDSIAQLKKLSSEQAEK